MANKVDGPFLTSSLIVLEANIDDMNPQWFEPLMGRLLKAGALDVVLIPVIMKKTRPGTVLQVLAPPARRAQLLQIIFEETTTLGVRSYPVERVALKREIRTVSTPYGRVQVKIARGPGRKILTATPEHESCLTAAKKKLVPVRKVYEAAKSKALS